LTTVTVLGMSELFVTPRMLSIRYYLLLLEKNMSSQKRAIKGVVSNITVVDNETIEIDEGEYYLLLVLLNGSTDTTSCNEADEEPFA